MKARLIRKYDLGWFKKEEDMSKASELAASKRLLKESEQKEFFPKCRIYKEKYFFLNKSFIIYS
jgi:hypothetical protein